MRHHVAASLPLIAILAMSTSLPADLLLHEPFDYPEGSLTGQGGALGTAGTWMSTDSLEGSRPIPSTGWWVHRQGEPNGVGLSGSNGAVDPFGFNSYDGAVASLETSGGYAGLPGAEDIGDDDPHSGEPGRYMDAHIALAPEVTATFEPGTVTWFSFVSVRGWDRNEESPQLIIGTDFTSSGARALTWNIDGGGQGIGGGGAPPRANYGDILPSYIDIADGVGRSHITPGGYLGGVLGDHDGVVDIQGPNANTDGALESGVQTMLWEELTPDGEFGPAHIVVGRIEWDADVDGEDIISVVRFLADETPSEEAFEDLIDAQPALSSANWPSNKPDLDQALFDTLNFSGTKYFVDEVRIATTFEEAVPAPGSRPPCDTVCDSLTVETIDEPGANVLAMAAASDGSEGVISYRFAARESAGDVRTIGPQEDAVARFDLPPGEWTVSVVVSDDSDCSPPSPGSSCAADPLTILDKEDVGPFLRADVDADGRVNITDAIFLLSSLFLGGPLPTCAAAGDANADEEVNITDAIYILSSLFLGGPAPAAPYPDCGTSRLSSDAAIGCATPHACP